MTEDQLNKHSMIDPSRQGDSNIASAVAAATTQICIATMVLLGTFVVMCWIVCSGRFSTAPSFSKSLNLLMVLSIPLLTNIAAAQRLRRRPVLSTILLGLTCVGCGWHLFLFAVFTVEILSRGIVFVHGLAAVFLLLTLLIHFATAALIIPMAMVAERRLGVELFFTHLGRDIRTSRPKIVAIIYGGTAILLCLIAAWCSSSFLRPERTVSFAESYQISAMSDDLQILAIGNSHGNFMSRGTETTLILLDTKTLEPVTQPVPLPQSVSQLRFISPEFGYLAMLANGKYRGLPDETSAAPASLVQVKTDGTVRQIRDGLPNDVHNLELSVHRDIAAVVCMNQETREASVHFIRLIDGDVLSSYSFSDVVTYELQFLRESDRAILLVEKPNLNHPNSWTCQLLGVHENSVEEVLQNMSTYGPQTAKPVSSTTGVHEFNTSGALISIWFDSNHWCYRFGPPEVRSNEPHNFVRHASDRMVFAENYAGSSWGNTILFYKGDPPELIDRRIESDDELNDLEFCPDGSRLFLLETVKHVGTRVSVYRFPES